MKVVGVQHDRPELALLLPSLRGGGAERVLMDLAMEIAGRGVAVDMVVVNREDAVAHDLGPRVRMVDLERSRVALALPALVTYLRSQRPRALLTTLEHTNVLAVLAGRLAGRARPRVVVREANTVSVDLAGAKGRFVREAMRIAYRAADGVVAVSDGVARSLVNELGLDERRVRVIYNPVLTPRVYAGAAEGVQHPWFDAGEPPVVLGVGRLTPQKGFDTLLRAFALVRAALPCRLLLLGEGEQRQELLALAAELGVGDDCAMPGFSNNPFAYMARCGVFVLSSRWEGLPNVLIQAMAVGASAVATDCPSGPAEVTDGGELAPLVPVDDVEALAAAIRATLAGAGGRRELPPGWRDRYDVEAVTAEYLALLRGDARTAQ
jgi:glycosyltransferase involved in cell wall biosynthesis